MKSSSKPRTSDQDKPDPEEGVKLVVQRMQADNLEFFVNTENEPTLKFPNDPHQKEWLADSQRVNDYLHSTHFELTKRFLKSSEKEYLLAQIREDCRTGGMRLSEDESAETEQDPIIQAVLYLMNQREKFDGLTARLLTELRKIQSDQGVMTKEDLPSFVNVFSRQLRRLIPKLKGFGIRVSLEHKEDGSHCKLERLADFQAEPTDGSRGASSGESSGVSSIHGESLPKADDTDAIFRTDKRRSETDAYDPRSTEEGGAK